MSRTCRDIPEAAQTGRPQDDHDPDFRGRGSYIGRMAGATGVEPTIVTPPPYIEIRL